MRHRVLGFTAALVIGGAAFAFGQAPQRGQGGQTFTTNGNGGLVDANGQPAQRGQRGPAVPARPAPRGPDGRVTLNAPALARSSSSTSGFSRSDDRSAHVTGPIRT